MKDQEFKIKRNVGLVYFEVMYFLYTIYMIFVRSWQEVLVIALFGAGIFVYFELLRPYKYVIRRRNIIEKRRLGKDREYNIMKVNTITDPIANWKHIVINPRALEIYFEDNRLKTVSLQDGLGFIAACLFINKRIHVNVKTYNEVARKYEKRNRKQEEKMRKHGYKMED